MKSIFHSITLIFLTSILSGCALCQFTGTSRSPHLDRENRTTFNYKAQVGYDLDGGNDTEEFSAYISKHYLNDIKKISDNHKTLPSITMSHFSDVSGMTNSIESSEEDLSKLTYLFAGLLKETKLFENVFLDPQTRSTLTVQPYVEVSDKSSSPIGQLVYVTGIATFGIISPMKYSETIKFRLTIDSAGGSTFIAEGIGGAYSYIGTVWLEDDPDVYKKLYRKAFGSAFENLIEDLIKKSNQGMDFTGKTPVD